MSVAWVMDVLDSVYCVVSALTLESAGYVVDGEFASAGELFVDVGTHFVGCGKFV